MTEPIVVVNIISTSYSGSTWLNLLLGSHSQAFSAGEMKLAYRVGRALCSLHGAACPVWSRFRVDAAENPFRQLARITGRRCLIVNNSRRLLPFQHPPEIAARYIFLVRDGRAVTASFLRKQRGRSMWTAARWWARNMRRRCRFVASLPPEHVRLLRYEDLLADTPGRLAELTAFVGLDFEPAQLDYQQHEHHYIGGNPGTLTQAAGGNVSQEAYAALGIKPQARGWDLSHYQRTPPARFRDERWRSELSAGQLRLFALLAGRWNRHFGYEAGIPSQPESESQAA